MGVAEVAALVREAAERPDLPPLMAEQLRAVLGKKLAVYERVPAWCVPEVPRRCLRALGGPEPLGDRLAAACVLYNCAGDIIDDAQDDELDGNLAWRGWDWRDAVNVGTCLLFTHGAFLAGLDAPGEVRAGWARAFCDGGRTLTAGQHVDLRAHADADLDEEAVLRLGAEKAGAAIGAFASLAPLWAGRPDVPAWRALGVTIGQLFQLVSDLAPYGSFRPHADLAAAKLTLPLLVARDLDPGIAGLWRDGLPLPPAAQDELRRRVVASGAVSYARMRVEILQREASSQIDALGVPTLATELAPVLQAADLGDEGPNI